MIRTHSRWLTHAVLRGASVPRIPTRRVSHGGFSHMMSTPSGRARAQQWWTGTLTDPTLEP